MELFPFVFVAVIIGVFLFLPKMSGSKPKRIPPRPRPKKPGG